MAFFTRRLAPWMIVFGALATTACGKKDEGGGAQAAPAKKTAIQVCNDRYKDSYDRNNCYQTSYQKEIDSCESKHRNDRTKLSTCYDAVEKRYRSVSSAIGGGYGRYDDNWRYDRDNDRFGWDDRWRDDRYQNDRFDDMYYEGDYLVVIENGRRSRIDCRRERRTCEDYEYEYRYSQRYQYRPPTFGFCLGFGC